MRRLLPGCLCLLLGLTACAPGEPAKQKLIVTGSSTIAPLVAEMARRFESLNPQIQVDVQSGGSSRGIADVRKGIADIGMVSRDPGDDERDLQWYAIARDGIGIIVNRQNDVTQIPKEQLRAVYTGTITDWNQVNGHQQQITVVNKAEGRSTLDVFLKYFALKNSDIKPHVIVGENQQGIKTVAGNTGAIGYVSIGSAESAITEGVAIKLLPMNSVAASVLNVRSGSFPIARSLHLVTRGKIEAISRRFITFAQSDKVHDLIEAQYFVPLTR